MYDHDNGLVRQNWRAARISHFPTKDRKKEQKNCTNNKRQENKNKENKIGQKRKERKKGKGHMINS